MQTSFLNVFKYHLSGQLFARLFSFLINLYLIRNVDLPLLGFLSVRMNLLYQTVGFLSREPLRKTCLNPNLSIKDSFHYALFSTICCIIWWFLPLPLEVELNNNYFFVLLSFAVSLLLEGIVEPIAILSLKLGENAHYALSHSLLILFQRLIAFLLIFFSVDTLTAFCIAQVCASLCYSIIHSYKFFNSYVPLIRKSFCGSWFADFAFYRYKKKYLVLIGTIFIHSILKQFITDGSAFVMTFTNIFSLKTQAVYDAVERLASLVTRLILTPLEESAAIYFSSNIRHSSKLSSNTMKNGEISVIPKKAITTFISLLRLIVVLGLIVCLFGFPYSRIVVQIYGGDILTENEGSKFLSFYTIYIFFMAINGITECFAFASMDTPQIFSHGTFLLFSVILHLIFNLILSTLIGATGFIIANCINTIIRIFYNWQHIRSVIELKKNSELSFKSLLPSFNLVILLVIAFFLTLFSYMIFGSTSGLLHNGAHIAVGGIIFLFVMAYVYQSEDLFVNFLEKIN